MAETYSPACPIPGLGHCVGERCNFWDPDQGCLGTGISFAADPSNDWAAPGCVDGMNMASGDQSTCPLPGRGYCRYDRCPYGDAARQECEACCQPSLEAGETGAGDRPCTIHWTEDFD